MNNQDLLNSVSLEEASSIISKALITERHRLEEVKNTLLQRKKEYEEAYVIANDGDSSENAPLEAAIQNLKLVTGEIGNNARTLQIMEGLEDVQYLIGTYNFSALKSVMERVDSTVQGKLLSIFEVNSFEELTDKFRILEPEVNEKLCVDFYSWIEENDLVDNTQLLVKELVEFLNVDRMPRYNTCGVIVPYTTVRLELDMRSDKSSDINKLMTYKIYPDGVSFIDIGVMAGNARVARALLGKTKGQSISIRHDSTGNVLMYKIIDIY